MIDLGVAAEPETSHTPPRVRGRRIALAVAGIAAVGLVTVALVTSVRGGPGGSTPRHPGTAAVGPSDAAAVGGSGAAEVGPSATGAPVLIPVGVAVIVEDDLVLPDGTSIAIPGGENLQRGYQTRDGWLIEASAGLWLVKPDHSVHQLSTAADVAVAPDGTRFAWRTETTMSVGHLDGDKLVPDTTVPAPAEGTPFRYTGTAVILGGGCCDGISKFDVWIPAKGPYVPSWAATAHVRGVDAVRPGTTHVIGQVAGPNGPKDACLAELDPAANLRAVWTACGINRFYDNDATVSPDGHWLAIRTNDPVTSVNAVGLVDLTEVGRTPKVAQYWMGSPPCAWLDGISLLCRGSIPGLVRLSVGTPDGHQVLVPGVTNYVETTVLPLQRLS
jgi:hypothetical protein